MVWVKPVADCVAATLTPTKARPSMSVTIPRTDAPGNCARSAVVESRRLTAVQSGQFPFFGAGFDAILRIATPFQDSMALALY